MESGFDADNTQDENSNLLDNDFNPAGAPFKWLNTKLYDSGDVTVGQVICQAMNYSIEDG